MAQSVRRERLLEYPGTRPRAAPPASSALREAARRRGDPSRRQWGTGAEALRSMTEYDSFPYRRWFRGEPRSPLPVVHPRIAGWYPRQDAAYDPRVRAWNEYDQYPRHCFQAACTTRLPSKVCDRYLGSGDGGLEYGCGSCGGCADSQIFDAPTHKEIVMPP